MTHPFTTHDIVRLRHQERVALGHAAIQSVEAREAHELLAPLAPPPRKRGPADTGAHGNQLSAVDSRTCHRARRTLSVVLDGEASATEVAETARHLLGCRDCADFAALVAELKHRLRAASSKRP